MAEVTKSKGNEAPKNVSKPARNIEAELKTVREQAAMISKSYLDMRDTARDIAAIVEAQGRLFKKLPGIAEIPKK